MPKPFEDIADQLYGLRIREVRNRLGVTQAELGSRIGCSEQQVQRMESGTRNVSLAWLRKIAVALDVHISELIEDGDGLSQGEREIIAMLRANPHHRTVINATMRGLREAAQSDFTPDKTGTDS